MTLSRNWQALATTALMLGGLALTGQQAPAEAAKLIKKPNILLFLTDDVGLDQLRIMGYGGIGPGSAPPTPNLAALQTAGLTFRNSWTMPACSTARGVLYSGRYPFRTQLEAALGPDDLANSMISPYERTAPKILKEAGYATGLFGKFHIGLQGNNPFKYAMPSSVGWDYYSGWLDETGDPSSIDTTAGGVAGAPGVTPAGPWPNGYIPGSNYGGADSGACYTSSGACRPLSTQVGAKNPAGRMCRDDGGIFVPNAACETTMPSFLNFTTLSAHYVSPLVINDNGTVIQVPPTDKDARTFRNVQQTDAAIAWIKKQQQQGKPWFATVSTATVHTPMQVPPIDTLPPAATEANGLTTDTTEGKIIIANQMIEAMDHEFGRLLVSTGLAKKVGDQLVLTAASANTVVLYVNDNGSLGSQVRAPFNPYRAKGTPYQTGVWTPMVVAGKGVQNAGQNVDALVNIADFYELIGNLGGVNVRKNNPRIVDSVTMLPYLTDNNYPSIRKYDFNLVGPNLQADGGMNGPCQFPGAGGDNPSCSQIPVTKSVCEDNGGVWFGVGGSGDYESTDSEGNPVSIPIPSEGFKYCCQVQQYIADNNGTPGTVVPVTGLAVRDLSGFKLVRNQWNNYDASSNSCVETTTNELYVVNNAEPVPLLDNEQLLIPTPYSPAQQKKYNELTRYMDATLNSERNCLDKGDGNNDGVVNRQDIRNYYSMIRLTTGSSWYDVNLDGDTNQTDLSIIISNQGYSCRRKR